MKTFTARVVERREHQGRPAVILDQTALYPEGGGQPSDRGWLNDIEVIDVIDLEDETRTVLHVLSEPLDTDEVAGRVDWARRFDHMQQHTGQHILSQAFVRVLGVETVSFHMSEATGDGAATIDLNQTDLPPAQIDAVEDAANWIVFENRLVTARRVAQTELASIPLRKPPKVDTSIRLVEIEGFDWSACGGTHVARTGEVGPIKIVKLERRGSEARVEFRCGWRVLIDYRRKHAMISRVAADLSIGYGQLDQALERLTAENKLLRKQIEDAQARMVDFELAEVMSSLRVKDSVAVALRVWPDRDMAALRRMAKQAVARPGTVALFGSGGARPALVFARSSDAAFDMNALLREAAARIGGKGGGAPDFAQAGGPPASDEQVQATLEWAYQQIVERES
jgi:alanyl-tRNA synthetase